MPVTSARGMNPEIVMATIRTAVPVSPARAAPCRSVPGQAKTGRSASECRNGIQLRGDGPSGPDRPDQDRRSADRPFDRPQDRRAEAQILSLIGGVFLAIALIDFLREVDAVIAAGRTGRQTQA